MKSVQNISATDTYDLRQRVLRPGQPLEMCQYLEDTLPSTFHLGIFLNGQIVCNGTFIQQAHEAFSLASKTYRLRGMATDPLHQKKGLGRLVIAEALKELKKRDCDLLWFNARLSAELFYQKLGFKKLDRVFEIPTIGPHRVMYKNF